ncbi:MAG TPA: AMP-binding protein, partial [Gemmatimonadaceae bacterium]|nr:AMP-binding protein [Gemmatimonadaceae bacterium]
MTESRWVANYDDGIPASLHPYPDLTLLDYLREAATKWPHRAVLLFQGATVDYQRLDEESDVLAAALSSMGVGAGDRVAICLPNCPQFFVAEFGAWKLGAIACPFNPTYTERETEDALQTTGAETIVVLNRFYEKIKAVQPKTSLKRVIACGIKDYLPLKLRLGYTLLKEKKDGERIELSDGDFRLTSLLRRHRGKVAKRVAPDDPATILMSGGTTGTPKGVVGSHRGMVVAGHQLKTWLSPAMNEWTDSILMPLPLFHTYGNTGVQSLALINHNPISLIPNPRDIPALLREIKTTRPAFICTVPTLLHGIMNHSLARTGAIDFHSIKLCFSGAAALMAETR